MSAERHLLVPSRLSPRFQSVDKEVLSSGDARLDGLVLDGLKDLRRGPRGETHSEPVEREGPTTSERRGLSEGLKVEKEEAEGGSVPVQEAASKARRGSASRGKTKRGAELTH
jgi:hypothetical protein